MSPSGWPEGKSRGPWSGKRRAASKRMIYRKKLREAALSSGKSMGGWYPDYKPQRAHVDVSPAVWLRAQTHVDDYAYVENGCDDYLLRDLERGVVYASSVTCHHEPVFQDLTIKVIAETEKYHRKKGTPRKKFPLPEKTLETKKRLLKKVAARKKRIPVDRKGTPLTTVVEEMFPKTRVGRPLIEVVSELYDSLKGAA